MGAPEAPRAAAAGAEQERIAPMSGFDTNPFADPVDINPFQVGAGRGRPPWHGTARPGPSVPRTPGRGTE